MPKQTITLCSVLACDTVNVFGSWTSSSQDRKSSSEERSGHGDGTVVYELGAGEKLGGLEISHGLKWRAGAAHFVSEA